MSEPDSSSSISALVLKREIALYDRQLADIRRALRLLCRLNRKSRLQQENPERRQDESSGPRESSLAQRA
jgi:hypothetical protein